MDVELITDPEALAGLRTEWDDLLSRCSHVTPFMSYEWNTVWWKHFGRPGALRVICVRDGGRLVGLAPLEQGKVTVRGVPLFRTLSPLGGREADYKDFLLDHTGRWGALETVLRYCQEQLRGWDLIIVRGVHECSPSNYLLPIVAEPLGLRLSSCGSAICPYVPLAGTGEDTWTEYRKRGVVKEYFRKWKKLQREHEARVETLEGEEAVEQFLRLHRLGWQGRGGSQAIGGGTEQFHRDFGQGGLRGGAIAVTLLYAQERPVAARYNFEFGSCAWEYLTGFDPQWRVLSPGAVLTAVVMDRRAAQGYREVDLMRGEEAYKFNFTRVARRTQTHAVARSASLSRRYELAEALSRPR